MWIDDKILGFMKMLKVWVVEISMLGSLQYCLMMVYCWEAF
jgi:hypothetical protein